MRLNILAFAAGVLLLQFSPALPEAWPWGLGGLALAVPALRWRGWRSGICAFAACCVLGFAWAAWRAEIRLADELGAAWEGQDVELVGVIAALPQDFSQGTRFEFVVEQTPPEAIVPSRLMLSWYQGRRDEEDFIRQPVRPGERWRFTVRLKRPHGNANPGAFDYEAWLLERNLRATGYIRPNPPQRLDEMVWRPDFVIERLRHAVRTSFFTILPPENYPLVGILVALAVGDQRAIDGGDCEIKPEVMA